MFPIFERPSEPMSGAEIKINSVTIMQLVMTVSDKKNGQASLVESTIE